MSEVADLTEIKELDQLKREFEMLKRENNAALKTIDKLLKDLNKKNEEIKHLQGLINQTVPVIVPEQKKLTKKASKPEQEIADAQLELLRNASQIRPLTLEEIKMYDLLVKNKRLAQTEPKNAEQGVYRDVKDIELIQVAQASISVPDDSDNI